MNSQGIHRKHYEQAADWLLQVQAEGAQPEIFAAMLAWCDADPAHKLAMEKIEEAWALSGELPAAAFEPPRAAWWRGRAQLAQWKEERFGRYGGLLLAGTFAALVLAVGIAGRGVLFERNTGAGERLATARGEHEQAKLPDGSIVELGGKSSLSVVYSPQNRVVVAEDGEAFYRVSKDPGRPFVVRAGPVTVTAVGTAFSVRRSGESVSVVVTEGAVEVRAVRGMEGGTEGATEGSAAGLRAPAVVAVRAAAGQRVRFDRGELTPAAESVVPDVAIAWRDGRLQFVDEPLRLVIASANRYYERELLIDPSLEELRFTGTVFEKGIDSWLQGVAAVFPVRIIDVDKRRVMIAPITTSKS